MKQYTFRYQDSSQPVSEHYHQVISTIKEYLHNTSAISTETAYQSLLSGLDAVIMPYTQSFQTETSLFDYQMGLIESNRSQTFPTPWGGVSHTFIDVDGLYEKDINKRVKKYLVIKQRGILGFEIHKEKYEHLEVTEGACLFIYSNHKHKDWKEGEIFLTLAEKGATATLLPGDEHGMIALINCVVQETSSYHLDDLIFLFNSQQFI